ncbi:MAG: DUF503 domain-containing protein [Calditrichia bacterium]
MQWVIGLLVLDLYLPGAGSLKEKRMVLKSLKDKIRQKYNVSIAEVGFQEKWQRAQLGIVQVGSDYGYVEQNIDKIFRFIESNMFVEVLNHQFDFI